MNATHPKEQATSREVFIIQLIIASLLLGCVLYSIALRDAPRDVISASFIQSTLYLLIFYLALLVIAREKTLIFFISLLIVYIVFLLACPILQYYRPELLWNDHIGCRLGDLFYIVPIIALGGIFFSMTRDYYRSDFHPQLESAFPLNKIVPEKARTLQEILQQSKKENKVQFRYGEADKGLVARFYKIYYKLRYHHERLSPTQKKIFNYSLLGIIFLYLWCIQLPANIITEEYELKRDREYVTLWVEQSGGSESAAAAALLRLCLHYEKNKMLQGKSLSEVKSMLGLEKHKNYPVESQKDGISLTTLAELNYNRSSYTIICVLDEKQNCKTVILEDSYKDYRGLLFSREARF